MATPTKTNTKTNTKTATKKALPKYHLAGGEKGYAGVTKCRVAFSALTIAALKIAGYVTITKSGCNKARTNPNKAILRAIAGPTMVRYWASKDRINDKGIMKNGLNEISARLTIPKYAYRTSLESVNKVLAALKSGGLVEIDGHKIEFVIPGKKLAKEIKDHNAANAATINAESMADLAPAK